MQKEEHKAKKVEKETLETEVEYVEGEDKLEREVNDPEER